MLTAFTQERQLEPRYRRVLSFGDLLDESISLYRRHWLTFAMVSAIWLLPAGLLAVWLSTFGLAQTTQVLTGLQFGRSLSALDIQHLTSAMAAIALTEVVSVLLWLAYVEAIVATSDAYLHGVEQRLFQILGRSLRAYPPALLSGCMFVLGLAVLTIVATVILIIPILDALLFLAAFVGLLVWWVRPTIRPTWLKWLIIVGLPLGLPTYFSIVWSMFPVATIVERRGPFDSLRRSAELVAGQWFRVFGIATLAWTIVAVLQFAPSALVEIPLMISTYARGQIVPGAGEQAASVAVGVLTQILFASVAPIAYTLIFTDLRNRREGIDIAERLSQLETLEPSAVHG